MRNYSFSLSGARLAYLLTITRTDETVIRVTNYVKSVTVDGVTWTSVPGLEIGDNTETNRGDVPNLSFSVATGSLFSKSDITRRAFERATALLEITNAANPTSKDFEFSGNLKGAVVFDPMGNAQFEILNGFGLQRDIFVRKYTIEDDVDFGDPRRSKIPTLPTIDPTSDDLADVGRSETLTVGERRRFRYDTNGDPSDYHNVYWEVTASTGATGGSEPVTPSDTPGDTVIDGDVEFTVRDAYARAFQVDSIIDSRHVTITVSDSRAIGDDSWFAPGLLVMRTGDCKNRASDVDAWDGVSQISLVVPFGNLLSVGDWGEITPDYDQTLDMAVDKYDNANNYRGFPHLTGARLATSTFVPGVIDEFPGDDPGGGGGSGGGGGEEGGEALFVEFDPGTG